VSSVRSPEFSPPPNARKHKTSFSSIDESQSNLESYDAQRKRQERAIESEQQRKERLVSDRLSKRATRENESEDHQQIRLADDRLSKRTTRENESEDHQQIRLADDRLSKRMTRENESEDHQQTRLADDRLSKRTARENESEDHQQIRLADDRLSKRTARENESEDHQQTRLARDRVQKLTAREYESEDHQQTRLADQQQRSATNRLSRSEQRSGRLTNRQQHSNATRSMDRQQSIRKPTEVVNMQREQQLLEKEQRVLLNQYVWPTAIPTKLKEYCLQDFSNHMSMPVLRQSTCIICNIRASASTMKECALKDIPNLDKLSCHADLMNIIPQTQQGTQGKYFNRVNTLLHTSLFEKGYMNIQALSLYRTQSSTKKDIIQQQRLVTSVNNATVHCLKIRSQCSL
jgi:hypothetical protein